MRTLSALLSPRSTRTFDLGGAMRVIDIPGIGSYNMVTGQGVNLGRYGKSPWAFACMQIRGSELANLPWRITRNGVILERHPLIDLLGEFGTESNYAESVQATEIDLLMLGKAFWYRDADLLQRLNPSTITVKSDRTGIQAFVQTIEGREVNRFARDEIVYFREFNPDNDLAPGVPVLDVVKGAVSIEYEAGLYAEAFFKNDATPSILLSTDQAIQEQEMDRIKTWWEKTFRGSKKAHKTGFADKGMKAQVLSSTMKDIALTTIRDQARNDICAGMRVPKILVGAMEEATYANAQEARRFMLEDVIIPRSKYFADVINADLVRKVDPSVRFEFVPQDLQILQEGANEKWKRLSDAVSQGAISLAFARAEMGWPETAAPTGDEAPIPVEDTVFDTTARSWARKAKKALRAGKSANVDFQTDEIPQERQQAIRARLSAATTPAEVERAFGGVQAVRASVDIPTIHVDVHVPEQPAPVVSVAAPQVTVAAPEVNVQPPAVTVNVPKPPRITGTVEHQKVERTPAGTLTGTEKYVSYNYEDEP